MIMTASSRWVVLESLLLYLTKSKFGFLEPRLETEVLWGGLDDLSVQGINMVDEVLGEWLTKVRALSQVEVGDKQDAEQEDG